MSVVLAMSRPGPISQARPRKALSPGGCINPGKSRPDQAHAGPWGGSWGGPRRGANMRPGIRQGAVAVGVVEAAEEAVADGDGVDVPRRRVLRHLRVDPEGNGHVDLLARLQRLLFEAEAGGLVEVLPHRGG